MFKNKRILVILTIAGLVITGLWSDRSTAQSQTPASVKSATAQDPGKQAAEQESLRINTQLVQIDVVVTDKKNKHVQNLTQDDFEVMVDGAPQSLTYFSQINLKSAVSREKPSRKKRDANSPPAPPESMPTRLIEPDEVQRTIAFVVDDLGLSFRSTEFVRETLRKFVAEQMQEGDLVAIIRTGNGLGMLEQFTSDKRVLYSAIERLTWNPLSRDMMPGYADGSADVSQDAADNQSTLDLFEEFRETSFTTGTLGTVGFVMQGLRALPGRKSVVLLSDGFRINSRGNDDNTTQLILNQMQNLIDQAGRSGVVVYSMDAKGLQAYMPGADTGGRPSASSYSDAMDAAQEALEGPVYLSKQTGGFVVRDTNDLNIGIQEALYDQQSYYLLGFDPDDETFDRKFHKLNVKVKRPGLTVRARAGFFGVAEEELKKPETRGEQLLTGLLDPLGRRELPIRMTPYYFNSTKTGPIIRSLFHIDCSKLTFQEGTKGEKLLKLDLAAFAFDETGAAADVTAHRINLSFDEEQYRRVLTDGLSYHRDFKLKKPGSYQFRAILRDDASGQTGAASQFIQAPDINKKYMALSGLVLTAPKISPSAPDSEKGAVTSDEVGVVAKSQIETSEAGNAKFGSTTATPYVRQFPRSGWIQYGAAIYNAVADKKTGQPKITVQAEIYQNGKRIHQFQPRQLTLAAGVNPKHFDYVGRLRLNDFPEGEYLLRFIVIDGLAKKKIARAEQWMDFSVK